MPTQVAYQLPLRCPSYIGLKSDLCLVIVLGQSQAKVLLVGLPRCPCLLLPGSLFFFQTVSSFILPLPSLSPIHSSFSWSYVLTPWPSFVCASGLTLLQLPGVPACFSLNAARTHAFVPHIFGCFGPDTKASSCPQTPPFPQDQITVFPASLLV